MEFLSNFWNEGYGFIAGHSTLFFTMIAAYVIWPGAITKLFQKIEDGVNNIKFNVGGVSVDFSKYEWDDQVNHFLRDYVISLHGKASKIKTAVAANEMTLEQGEAELAGLTSEVVDYFNNKAPANLRQFAVDKFGGDKIAAAEYVYRRVQAIVHDLKADKKK